MLGAGDAAGARALYERALALDARSAPAEAGLARLDRDAGNLHVGAGARAARRALPDAKLAISA